MRSRRLVFAQLVAGLFSLASAARGEELGEGYQLLPPLRHGALTVFPVVKSDGKARDPNKYLSLRAGLEKKQVFVEELGSGGSVNQLRIANRSTKPLLVLGGEIVLGGQQDRVMAKDTILAPGELAVVEVFCVEHGRWSGARGFSAAGGMAEHDLRDRAKYERDQSAVWAEVKRKTAALKAERSTGTYRGLAAGDEGKKIVEPFRAAISAPFAKDAKHAVGLVAAIGGRVTSIELFDSAALFAEYRDQLLDALYVTAADQPASAAAAPVGAADARAFYQRAKASSRSESLGKSANSVERSADGLRGTELVAPAAKEPVFQSFQSH